VFGAFGGFAMFGCLWVLGCLGYLGLRLRGYKVKGLGLRGWVKGLRVWG